MHFYSKQKFDALSNGEYLILLGTRFSCRYFQFFKGNSNFLTLKLKNTVYSCNNLRCIFAPFERASFGLEMTFSESRVKSLLELKEET
jgi:hypothetical protein